MEKLQTVSIQEKFSSVLIEKRQAKGLSQAQLAQQLSVTRQAVSKWENGKSIPNASMLLKIAKTLDCTVNDLVTITQPQSVDIDVQQTKTQHHPTKFRFLFTKKTIAVWASVITCVIIICASLMGVYIPKSKQNISNNHKATTYVDVKVSGQGSLTDPYIYTDGSHRYYRYTNEVASPQYPKLYWRFVPDFNSDYTLHFKHAAFDSIWLDDIDKCPKLLINSVEYPCDFSSESSDITIFLLANTEYIIELDYTQCKYFPSEFDKTSLEITMRSNFYHLNIAPNSECTIAFQSIFVGGNDTNYKIRNNNVVFTKVQLQKKFDSDYTINYVDAPEPSSGLASALIHEGGKEVALFGSTTYKDIYYTGYYFVTIANNNDYAIDIDVKQNSCFGIQSIFTTFDIQLSYWEQYSMMCIAPNKINKSTFYLTNEDGTPLKNNDYAVYIQKEDETGAYLEEYLDYTDDENGRRIYKNPHEVLYIKFFKSMSVKVEEF